MSTPAAYSVKALTRAVIADDSSSVEFDLAAVGGKVTLLMTPNTLGQIVSHMTEVETAVQSQIGSTTGHYATPASVVQDFQILASSGGEKVVLEVKNEQGRFQAFAFSLEQSQRLRVDAKKAEEKARKLASQARN